MIYKKFENVIDKYPNNIALKLSDNELTYSDLGKKVSKVVSYFIKVGLNSSDYVGIASPENGDYIPFLLGCLRLGLVYIPISEKMNRSTLHKLSRDFRPKVVVKTEKTSLFVEHVFGADDNVTIILADEIFNEQEKYSVLDTSTKYTSDSDGRAYLFFTSGSVSSGKAVIGSLSSLQNYVSWHSDYFDFNTKTNLLSLAEFTFDASLKDTLPTLFTGGTVVIPSEEQKRDYESITTLVEDVTILQTVPSIAKVIFDDKLNNFRNLEMLLLSGEVFSKQLYFDLKENIPGTARLFNLYGLTEGTILQSYLEITDQLVLGVKGPILPIGTAIPGYNIRVKRESNQPLKAAIGEIEIESSFMTYDAESNCKIPVLKTGDVGAETSDGLLTVLGRIDNQVKHNGIRINLSVLEGTISKIIGITNLVIVQRITQGLSQLVCFFQCSDDLSVSLFDKINDEIPASTMPNQFVRLNSLPRTVNGKVDRKELRSLTLNTMKAEEVEKTNNEIYRIWKDVLGHGNFKADDSFFNSGGTSIRALQLLTRLSKVYERKISFKEFYENDSIDKLQAILEKNTSSSKNSAQDLMLVQASEEQVGIYLLEKLNKTGKTSIVLSEVSFSYIFCEDTLRKSLAFLIERYEILRTKFIEKGEGIFQVVEPFDSLNIPFFVNVGIKGGIRNFLSLENGPLIAVELNRFSKGSTISIYVHQIISDEWSTGILIKQLISTYSRLTNGEDVEKSELFCSNYQYRDYSLNRVTDRSIVKNCHDFWSKKIKKNLLFNDFPKFQGRRNSNTLNRQVVQVDHQLKSRIEEYASKNKLTDYMVLATTFAILLQEMCMANNTCIGTPIANRHSVEFEKQIGLFSRIYPLFSSIDMKSSFKDATEIIRNEVLDLISNSVVSFESVLQKNGFKGTGSPFNVVFSYNIIDDFISSIDNLIDGKVISYDCLSLDSYYDLNLIVSKSQNTLELSWNYLEKSFDSTFVGEISERFTSLLDKFTKNPTISLKKQFLLPKEKIEDLLAPYYKFIRRENSKKYSASSLNSLLSNSSLNYPKRIGLKFSNQKMSFSEMNSWVDRISHYLYSRYSITLGSRVAVKVRRSDKLILLILSLVRIGAAYIPMIPNISKSREEMILKDSNSKILIDDNELVKIIECCKSMSIPGSVDSNSNLSTIAYIIYTSGTTGKPKGVAVTHGNVISLLNDEIIEYPNTKFESWSLFHSVAFDFSVWEIFACIFRNSTLVVLSENETQDPSLAIEVIVKENVTILNQVPSMFSNIYRQLEKDGFPDIPITTVIFGGESINVELIKKFKSCYPSVRLYNMYGITETTVHVTSIELTRSVLEKSSNPIGKPLWNRPCFVVDEDGRLVAPGFSGELYVAGDGVSLGYINPSQEDEAKFITNFSIVDSSITIAKVFKSGDFVRATASGDLQYIGRKDDQVKIRGYRIELQDIESTLSRHQKVTAVACKIFEEDGSKEIALFYVGDIDKGEVRSYLTEHLQRYMVPTYIENIERLPTTSSGKIDKTMLQKGERIIESEGEFSSPISGKISRWMGETLSIDTVNEEDDFYAIGGHSFKALILLSKIENGLGIRLDVSDLLSHPTPRGLSAFIQSEVKQFDRNTYENYPNLGFDETQKELYIQYLFKDESIKNNMIYEVDLKEELSSEKVRDCISNLLKENRVLASRYFVEDRNFKIEVLDENLELNKIFKVFSRNFEKKMTSYLNEDFDLENGLVIKFAQLETKLYFSISHVVSDGETPDIIANTITEYLLKTKSTTNQTQFNEYVEFRKKWIASESGSAARKYWESKISGYDFDLLRKKLRSSNCSNVAQKHEFALKPKDYSLVKSIVNGNQRKLLSVLAFGVAFAMHETFEIDDLIVGTPVTTRTQSRFSKTIGPLINTLPLKIRIRKGVNVGAIYEEIYSDIVESLFHRLTPKSMMYSSLNLDRNLFEVGITLQNKGSSPVSNLNRNSTTSMPGSFWFDVNEVGEYLKIQLFYNRALYSEETIGIIEEKFTKGIKDLTINLDCIGINSIPFPIDKNSGVST